MRTLSTGRAFGAGRSLCSLRAFGTLRPLRSLAVMHVDDFVTVDVLAFVTNPVSVEIPAAQAILNVGTLASGPGGTLRTRCTLRPAGAGRPLRTRSAVGSVLAIGSTRTIRTVLTVGTAAIEHINDTVSVDVFILVGDSVRVQIPTVIAISPAAICDVDGTVSIDVLVLIGRTVGVEVPTVFAVDARNGLRSTRFSGRALLTLRTGRSLRAHVGLRQERNGQGPNTKQEIALVVL